MALTRVRLRAFLKEQKLHAAEFCRQTGVSPQKLSDYLNQRAPSLSPANLQRIAQRFPEGPWAT